MIPASQRLPRRFQNPIIPEPVRTWLECHTVEHPGATLSVRHAYGSFRGTLHGDERRAWPASRFRRAVKGLPIGLWGDDIQFANRTWFPPRHFVPDDLGHLIVEDGRLRKSRRQLRETLRTPARVARKK